MSSILLIQSDPRAAARLIDTLNDDARYAVCGSVASIEAARRALATRRPDLLISDLRVCDGSLHELLPSLRPGHPHVLATAASMADPHILHALRSGVDGFVAASAHRDEAIETIRIVLAGGSPISPEIARKLLALHAVTAPLRDDPLDRMDRTVLEWSSHGYRLHEVAHGLGITTIEIALRIRGIYRRLRVAATQPEAPQRVA